MALRGRAENFSDRMKEKMQIAQLKLHRVKDPERVLGFAHYLEDNATDKEVEFPRFDANNTEEIQKYAERSILLDMCRPTPCSSGRWRTRSFYPTSTFFRKTICMSARCSRFGIIFVLTPKKWLHIQASRKSFLKNIPMTTLPTASLRTNIWKSLKSGLTRSS